jgi:hypothetical protein
LELFEGTRLMVVVTLLLLPLLPLIADRLMVEASLLPGYSKMKERP